MKNDYFFPTIAKEFEINNITVNPSVQNKWNKLRILCNTPDLYKRKIIEVLNFIRFKKGYKILDVGCGIGHTIVEMAFLGGKCIGLDIAKDYTNLINSIGKKYNLDVVGVQGDACNLPFDVETFDLVMSREVFEHIPYLDKALKEQIRVLKRGGTLFIQQSNLLNPFTLLELLVKNPIKTHGKFGGIKWFFSKSKVKNNIFGSGWKDEDIHTRFWWKKKITEYSNLEIKELFSQLVNIKGHFKIIKRLFNWFFGHIYIRAKKR